MKSKQSPPKKTSFWREWEILSQGSPYDLTLVGFELAVILLPLPPAKTTGMYHHTHPRKLFLRNQVIFLALCTLGYAAEVATWLQTVCGGRSKCGCGPAELIYRNRL